MSGRGNQAGWAARGMLGAAVLWCAGCATGYWGDRGRDAADIFTCTAGIGGGAKARVGPLQAAAINNADLIGLRAGQWLANGNDLYDNAEMYFVLPIFWGGQGGNWVLDSGGIRRIMRREPWWRRRDLFGRETFRYGPRSEAAFRGKEVDAQSPLPLVAVSRSAPFYTQIGRASGRERV